MRGIIPNKITEREKSALSEPVSIAIAAFRLGAGDSEKYHTLTAALLMANEICGLVSRHSHLSNVVARGIGAINEVFNRAQGDAAEWSGTPSEVDAIEDGIEVYKALLSATPVATIRKAMRRVTEAYCV